MLRLQNDLQQGLIVSEDDDGITAITPSACLSMMRDAATKYPATSTLLGVAGGVALAWFEQDVFFPYRVIGTFGDGALSTYDEGRQAALAAFNHSTAGNYSIYQMSNTDYANPYQYDANRVLYYFWGRITYTALSSGLLDIALLSYFSKKSCANNALLLFSLTLLVLAMYVYVALIEAFVLVPRVQDQAYQSGQELGNSTYGFADGQNYYCSSLIYNGTCPDPSMYYTLLQMDANAPRITPAIEIIFLFHALATLMMAPVVSTVLSCGKGVYGYCRRSSLFGASENKDSDSYQYENESVDPRVSSMEVESQSNNERYTFQ